ncbi:alpha/beta fold hydrolase [Kibdelosporangium phytohabitans]|uniref:Hydrolase n=1 Tax=Kibdelosporangium phytohabitans TaxID=860235 RepID=A0A0N9HXD6_9PSEU|nr:alpha/beta hydrolase [Kibdelosporangium phytohabitans]ALG06724.1 hydrolase [Kibdelosporangium phytohabitans]MBE1467948.1 pimeloyl-ACP methyl ester carboxylesterase [Kibdelosporangium phytohabitans]
MNLTSERAPLTRVPLSDATRPPLDTTQLPWPGEHVEAGGVRLHVRRTPGPADETAVYVHGLGGSSMNWTDLAGQLSLHAQGIAVDMPGAGRSEPPPGHTFDLADQAGTLAAFLRGLGHGPVHLFGNSMGGASAMILAARHPDLVKTLTLISPAVPDLRPLPNRMSDPRIPFAMMPLIGERFRRQLAALTPMQRAQQLVNLCFADPSMVPQHRMHETANEFVERAKIAWAGQSLMSLTLGLFRAWLVPPSQSLWRIMPNISAPTLVIWGAKDKLVTVRKAPRTARLLPRGRLLVLPRTGHVAQMERPETVARAALGLWEAEQDGSW